MADIKDLGIFGAKNKGLQKIKEASHKKESSSRRSSPIEQKNVVRENRDNKKNIKTNNSVGAPIKNYDRIYVASQPIKLSALLNSTSRVLNEKYMAGYTRDEILRLALDSYIKMNFTKEDKIDLYRDVSKELNLFREKHPTIPRDDMTEEVIEEQSA
ncbi:hypothetical protein I1B29_003042, partial [Listeria monocytogenes]|nr:hypothetical protein [Listeria monocytogenes]EGP9512528.1 hypothetical protein [Listeria monocytogenes]EGP9869086.1 hypothetical protein [Listeria monocytogenes]